jgi:3-oxoacyl-[acyl-carrier protein] reductase
MQLAYPLLNKVAIVTGGSRGIGAATCVELASRGAKIALTYVSERSKAKAEAVAKDVEKVHKERDPNSDANVVVIQADAESLESPKKIVQETLKAFQTDTIDILVNNAGMSDDQFLPDITPEVYEKVMNVNCRGVIFLTQAVLPHFPKPRGGRIVNVSSVSATEGFFGQTVYAASKAAMDGFTRVWATELGRKYGVTVNGINPGPVDTDMFNNASDEFEKMVFETCPPSAENRRAHPQDIADIIGFLVDEKSRWVTGDIVCANGGGIYF